MVEKVNYLGYIVESGQIRPSDRKITAVANFPIPATVKQVQSFLGLAGYFRKFIPQFAIHARPLSQLLKKEVKFEFGENQKYAFEKLKAFLVGNPVLKLYQVGAETELYTDACMDGLGAVLLQRDTEDGKFHPVYYASWNTEAKYISYELEMLAVVKALKKFRVYLLNIHFKIVTDCNAFVWSMKKKDLCLRVSHWALLIGQFNYTIEHRPGTSMRHVDALSRNAVSVCLVRENRDELVERVKKAQGEDPELAKVITTVKTGQNSEFTLSKGGVLYREVDGEELMVIPSLMQFDIIKDAHEKGHFGRDKTESVIRREFWFPNMRDKIQKVINSCVRCVLVEKKQGKSEGLLNPIDKKAIPLDTYHIDHLGPLLSTRKAYNHVFVVVDAFTKFVWLYPTKSTTAEETVSKLKNQAVTFGNPRRIVSDRGTAFTSNLFKDYCESEKIAHVLITTGVPRANGQVERVNRVIISILAKLSIDNPMEWWKYVGSVQQFLNSTVNRSIKKTPFELLIGENMKLSGDQQLKQIVEEELVAVFEADRSALREEARNNILKMREENRKSFNKNRKKATSYVVGDVVAIQRTQFGSGLKLCPKFLGPYKIVTIKPNDRYEVEKIGHHQGPLRTTTAADYMKPWAQTHDYDLDVNNDDDSDSEIVDDEEKVQVGQK